MNYPLFRSNLIQARTPDQPPSQHHTFAHHKLLPKHHPITTMNTQHPNTQYPTVPPVPALGGQQHYFTPSPASQPTDQTILRLKDLEIQTLLVPSLSLTYTNIPPLCLVFGSSMRGAVMGSSVWGSRVVRTNGRKKSRRCEGCIRIRNKKSRCRLI